MSDPYQRDSALIEKAARAMWEACGALIPWLELYEDDQGKYRALARAALNALGITKVGEQQP